MEEVREVPGSNGYYKIDISTKEGKCWSEFSKRYLSSCPDKKGYIYWGLTINGKSKTQQAARWIAFTFPELVHNEYFEGAEIDHIDTDPLNNHPFNLRWVDRVGQMNNSLTRIHNSIAQTGKVLSTETKKKLSESHKGKQLPEETKKKISESHKGTTPSKETREKISKSLSGRQGHKGSEKQRLSVIAVNKAKSKPIMKMDDSGNVIAVYDSLAEAARITGLSKSNISHSALSDRKKCGGFRWAYKEKRAG